VVIPYLPLVVQSLLDRCRRLSLSMRVWMGRSEASNRPTTLLIGLKVDRTSYSALPAFFFSFILTSRTRLSGNDAVAAAAGAAGAAGGAISLLAAASFFTSAGFFFFFPTAPRAKSAGADLMVLASSPSFFLSSSPAPFDSSPAFFFSASTTRSACTKRSTALARASGDEMDDARAILGGEEEEEEEGECLVAIAAAFLFLVVGLDEGEAEEAARFFLSSEASLAFAGRSIKEAMRRVLWTFGAEEHSVSGKDSRASSSQEDCHMAEAEARQRRGRKGNRESSTCWIMS